MCIYPHRYTHGGTKIHTKSSVESISGCEWLSENLERPWFEVEEKHTQPIMWYDGCSRRVDRVKIKDGVVGEMPR